MPEIVKLGGGVYLLDLEECGQPGKTAGYLIKGKKGWMLVDSGPASSAGVVLEAAGRLGIKPGQLKYIALTHIHLDHGGGLGTLAGHFPAAGLVLHPAGARHMIDPSRLIAGAMKVWGREKMDRYGEVVPVDSGRVITVGDGDVVDLGDRKIQVWETPGHSRDHLCFCDSRTRMLFSGDAAGIFYPWLSRQLRRPVLRVATPPPAIDGRLIFKTLARLAQADVERICYSHFGPGRPPRLLLEMMAGQLALIMEYGGRLAGSGERAPEEMIMAMKRYYQEGLLGENRLPEGSGDGAVRDWKYLIGAVELSALGILQYLEKTSRGDAGAAGNGEFPGITGESPAGRAIPR